MVSVEGLDRVVAALGGQNIPAAKRAVKKRAYALVRRTRDQLRAATPEGATRNLRKSQKAKTTRGGGAVAYVDKSGGNSGKGYHFHLVTKGTKQRATKRGANRGTMPANDYASPIIDRAVEEAKGLLSQDVLQDIVATIKAGL